MTEVAGSLDPIISACLLSPVSVRARAPLETAFALCPPCVKMAVYEDSNRKTLPLCLLTVQKATMSHEPRSDRQPLQRTNDAPTNKRLPIAASFACISLCENTTSCISRAQPKTDRGCWRTGPSVGYRRSVRSSLYLVLSLALTSERRATRPDPMGKFISPPNEPNQRITAMTIILPTN